MDAADMIDRIAVVGGQLASAAREAGPLTPVPTCPGWTVADLLRHTGEVHRWASAIVAEAAAEQVDSRLVLGEVPADGELCDWLDAGLRDLVRTLRAAPEDLDCWYFMRASSAREFWVRRQLHETSVHRMDAELAAGRPISPVEDAVACDGVDELLTSFLPRRSSRLRSPVPRSLLVAPDDAPARWWVQVGDDKPVTVREDRPADAVIRGPVGQLYPVLWNRLPFDADGVSVEGDTGLLELWRARVTVSWR